MLRATASTYAVRSSRSARWSAAGIAGAGAGRDCPDDRSRFAAAKPPSALTNSARVTQTGARTWPRLRRTLDLGGARRTVLCRRGCCFRGGGIASAGVFTPSAGAAARMSWLGDVNRSRGSFAMPFARTRSMSGVSSSLRRARQLAARCGRKGDAEVRQHRVRRFALVHHDRPGAQVVMDQPLAGCRLQAARHLGEDPKRLVRLERAEPQPVGEGPRAGDQADQHDPAPLLEDAEDGQHVRMRYPRPQHGQPQQPTSQLLVPGQLRRKQRQRDQTAVRRLRLDDDVHPGTRRERSPYLVAVDQRADRDWPILYPARPAGNGAAHPPSSKKPVPPWGAELEGAGFEGGAGDGAGGGVGAGAGAERTGGEVVATAPATRRRLFGRRGSRRSGSPTASRSARVRGAGLGGAGCATRRASGRFSSSPRVTLPAANDAPKRTAHAAPTAIAGRTLTTAGRRWAAWRRAGGRGRLASEPSHAGS